MAKNSVADWDTTAGNNTDVGGINIAEGMAPGNVNNAMREMMAQLATDRTVTLPVSRGGTGATDAVGARTALGGTTVGSAVFTAANAAAARATLGAPEIPSNQTYVLIGSLDGQAVFLPPGGTWAYEIVLFSTSTLIPTNTRQAGVGAGGSQQGGTAPGFFWKGTAWRIVA